MTVRVNWLRMCKNRLYIYTMLNSKTNEIMKIETMKLRTEKQIIKMGYSQDEAKKLIEKYWTQTEYLSLAREKARYMTV
jgi:hypothetical protein